MGLFDGLFGGGSNAEMGPFPQSSGLFDKNTPFGYTAGKFASGLPDILEGAGKGMGLIRDPNKQTGNGMPKPWMMDPSGFMAPQGQMQQMPQQMPQQSQFGLQQAAQNVPQFASPYAFTTNFLQRR